MVGYNGSKKWPVQPGRAQAQTMPEGAIGRINYWHVWRMPALRPGHQRESINGGTVERVLHHLPGTDSSSKGDGIGRIG